MRVTVTKWPSSYVTAAATTLALVLALIECQFQAAGAISLEENGPRFMDDWISSVKFSSRVGGKLYCRAHGQPRPVIQWFGAADGLRVQNITGIREVDEDGTLHFHAFDSVNFRPDVHSTSYRCRASNQVGVILSPEIQLRAVVADLPYEIENHDVTVLRGNVAILRCLVPQQVRDFISVTSWIQDSTVNIYPSFQSGKYLLLPNGDLYVFNVDSSDGYKSFACRTSNKLTNEGKTSPAARIIVKESEAATVPVRVEPPKQFTVNAREGEDVYLPCGASSGQPPPQYTWFRERGPQDDSLLEISSKSSGIGGGSSSSSSWHAFPGGPLLLSGVKAEDGGIFVCWINNTGSSDQVRVQLNVYVPLHVQAAPRTQVVDVGRTATFRCSVKGGPVPPHAQAVEWLKDGKKIDGDSDEGGSGSGPRSSARFSFGGPEDTIGSSAAIFTLAVHSVHASDAGMYQCFARNELYSMQDSAQLRLGSVLPELIYRFTEQTLQPGPSVSLKCTAVGNPPPQFTWTLDGFPLPESERFMVGQYVTIHDNVISHLNITGVRDEDGGLVSCEARNAMGHVTHSARLNVYGPPYVRPIPAVKAVAGRTLQVQCPASGWPLDAVTWTRNGATLPVNRRQRVYANGTLTLEHVHRSEDEGVYECSARNRQGLSSSRDLHLQVIVAPKIMPFQFMSQLLKEGMRAAVSCQVIEGDRPFDFSWHFNDRPINAGASGSGGGGGTGSTASGVRVLFPDEYSSTLVIEVLESGHSGEYACIVQNAAGRESHAAQLTVNVPPKWTLEPGDTINVSAGQPVALHCQAQGHPQPSIVWRRAMGMHPGDYKDITSPSIDAYPNGTLRFHLVRKSHEGSYLCEARNGVGSGLSKVVYLKVNAPAQFLDRDREAHAVVSVRAQEKALLQCRATGDLPIEVQWSSRHAKISSSAGGKFTIRHSSQSQSEDSVLSELVIADVSREDGGAYFCRAGNMFGSDQTTVMLNVQEPPGQPINIRIVEQRSRTVHISWAETFNGNSPLLKYVVQYTSKQLTAATWPATMDDIRELAVPATSTPTPGSHSQPTANLEPLQPATTYHVRILAQNSMGFGPPSEVLQVTTSEEAPEAAPLNVQVEALSSTRLRVSWEPPDKTHWHGTILGYYLGYRELGSALLTEDGDVDGGADARTLPGFTQSQSPPHFRIQTELNGYHFRTVEVGIDFGGSAVLDNLSRYSRYIIITQAFNSQGHGPPSPSVIALTLQDVPSMPPEGLTCSAVSSTALKLSWQDPPVEGRHGIVQGYRIKYQNAEASDAEADVEQPGGGGEEGAAAAMKVLVSKSKSAVLHGLRKWANYTVQVLAFTSVGDGVWSQPPLTCATDEDLPSPPAAIKGLVSSRHSVHVSWLAPAQPNGVVQNYTLYMKSEGGNSRSPDRKHFLAHTRSHTLANLKEGQRYEFWVVAATRVGEGGPSQRVRMAPAAKVPARVASFSVRLQVPWKREFAMPCETVGVPEPSVLWKFNGNVLGLENTHKYVNGAGTLTVTEAGAEDSGNYSCTAANAHGSDTIVYAVSVQVPPSPPTALRVLEAGYDALQLEWTPGHDGGSAVRGFMVHYKRGDGGDWEEVEAAVGGNSKTFGFKLKGLSCGSKYQLYITTLNRIGVGAPSQTLMAETKGSSPTPPKKNDLLASNSSSISLSLHAWVPAVLGCPISRFVVEYKEQGSGTWIRSPHEYAGDTKFAYIRDLVPSTRYAIRVTAENPAGKSTANYGYQTTASAASKYVGVGDRDHEASDDDGTRSQESGADSATGSALSTSLLIVLPSILSLVAVTGVILVLCYFRRKRLEYGSGHRGSKGGLGLGLGLSGLGDSSLQMEPSIYMQEPRYCPVKTNEPSPAGALRYKAVDSAGRVSTATVEDVCPYATFQLPDKAPGRPVLHGARGSSKRKSRRESGAGDYDGGGSGSGSHTGDTLYNAGHIYIGPYHSVQSAAMPMGSLRYGVGLGYNEAPTMQLRESDYARIRGGGGAEAQHDCEYDYDTLGSESDEGDGEGADAYLAAYQQHSQQTVPYASRQRRSPSRKSSPGGGVQHRDHRQQQHTQGRGRVGSDRDHGRSQSKAQTQEMATFSNGQQQQQHQRSDLTSEHDDHDSITPSSDADDDGSNSSPSGGGGGAGGKRRHSYGYGCGHGQRHVTGGSGSSKSGHSHYFSRSKSKSSAASASASSSFGKRMRSSSGYSSHVDVDAAGADDVEEETSFAFYDGRVPMPISGPIQPPTRFSDEHADAECLTKNDEDYEEIDVDIDVKPAERTTTKTKIEGAAAAGCGYHHIHV